MTDTSALNCLFVEILTEVNGNSIEQDGAANRREKAPASG
jgi:hypothetical protein